jgi:hypothetical protein
MVLMSSLVSLRGSRAKSSLMSDIRVLRAWSLFDDCEGKMARW